MLKKVKANKIKMHSQEMVEKIKAHPLKKMLIGNWVLVTIVLISLYTVYEVGDQMLRMNAIKEERAAVTQKIEEEKAAQKQLLEECEKLQDPAYIEQVAREELGYVKEGEIPYISREKKTH